MAEEKVKLYVAGSCGPCKEVKKLIAEGKVNIKNIQIIDLEEGDNYKMLPELNLSRVPSAFQGDQTCELSLQNGKLVIDCAKGS